MVIARLLVFLGNAVGLRRHADDLFPQVQHPALRHARLQRLQTVDQFHKQRVLLHVLLVPLLRRALGRNLQHDAHHDEQRNGAQRQDHQRTGDVGEKQHRHDEERQVDERQQRRRAEEFTQRLEFAQVVDERAGGLGFGVQTHGQDLLHQTTGQHHVRVAPGHVHEITPQVAKHEVEPVGDQDADGQHPQRVHRVVGDDAVVHVHDEQRADDADEVDDHAGEGHMAIDRQIVQEDVPEPPLALEQADPVGALVQPGARGEMGVAGIPSSPASPPERATPPFPGKITSAFPSFRDVSTHERSRDSSRMQGSSGEIS